VSQNILGSERKLSSEALLSNIIPFAGSGLGYAMGFAFKKILKWVLIIVGFLAGTFFVGVQLLQKYAYVSTVNWDRLGNDTSTQIQHLAVNVDVTNVHGLFHTLGIPVSAAAWGWDSWPGSMILDLFRKEKEIGFYNIQGYGALKGRISSNARRAVSCASRI
jgi:uncharacterized membrane protein (Fun14 family)